MRCACAAGNSCTVVLLASGSSSSSRLLTTTSCRPRRGGALLSWSPMLALVGSGQPLTDLRFLEQLPIVNLLQWSDWRELGVGRMSELLCGYHAPHARLNTVIIIEYRGTLVTNFTEKLPNIVHLFWSSCVPSETSLRHRLTWTVTHPQHIKCCN